MTGLPRRSRDHSAGFLTFEAEIKYPFQPLIGQTVLVVGDQVHDGVRYFLIRQAHGGTYHVPEWMFDQGAGVFAIVAVPRLPVGQLILLRRLVDQLMSYSPGNEGSGGIGHEKIVAPATGLVPHCRTGGGVKRHGAADGRGVSASVTDRGDGAGDREHNGPDLAGGRQ
jgi:Family of unknown function (DUF5372)